MAREVAIFLELFELIELIFNKLFVIDINKLKIFKIFTTFEAL